MINAWSLLYDEIYGDDEMTDNRVTPQESDEYDPKPESTSVTSLESDEYDPIITIGSGGTAYDDPKYYASEVGYGNTASASDGLNINLDEIANISIDTSAYNYPDLDLSAVDLSEEFTMPSTIPDVISKPKPSLKDPSSRKYQEDKGIEDLKNYVTSTYQGHYTNDNSDVQTLDLIHSVGDAESFCRSNAIKYLSRYDKKGSAKNDILKAMHYCLLLYYFSGNTKEPNYTNTRYETF